LNTCSSLCDIDVASDEADDDTKYVLCLMNGNKKQQVLLTSPPGDTYTY
jgi:hypothetical protein